jgi:copper homeostasis protein
VHLSAKRSVAGGHDGVPMGSGDDGSGHTVTDAAVVAAARTALDQSA